jgi:hypothetical protein
MPNVKALLLFLALMFALYLLVAQTPDWMWASQVCGYLHEQSKSIVTDAAGNIYVTGYMEWTATFGSVTLETNGASDIFVAKLSPSGEWLWALNAGGHADDGGSSIALDNEGNILVCGTFENVAAFGQLLITGTGDRGGFVAKLDPDGNWLWACPCNGISYVSANSLALDQSGNCFVTGSFIGTLNIAGQTLVAVGMEDAFAAKLDSSGNWLWAVQAGGTDNEKGLGIAADAAGSVRICGNFRDSVSFGAHTLTSQGGFDIFVARLDPSGNWLWIAQAGGPNTSDFVPDKATGIVLDASGNAYITGIFLEYACFGSTCFSTGGASNADAYVAKLDPAGNWLWAAQAHGTSTDSAYGICLGSDGLVSVTGCFYETINFFGPGSLTSLGYMDIFAAQLDAGGNWLRAWRAGAASLDAGYGIAAGLGGNLCLTGYFMGTAEFGGYQLTSSAGIDIFVAGIGTPTEVDDGVAPSPSAISALRCSPNPFTSRTRISFQLGEGMADCELAIYDLRGTKITILHQGRLEMGNQEFTWICSPDLPAGVYFYRLRSGSHVRMGRMVSLGFNESSPSP